MRHELVIPSHGFQAVTSVALASGMWPFVGTLGFLMHPLVGILMWGVGFALSWTAFRERKESVIRWRSDDTELRVTVGGGPEQLIRLQDLAGVRWCYGTLLPNWDGYNSWTHVEFHLADGESLGVFLNLVTPREQWTALRDLARALGGCPIDVEWDSWIPRREVTWDPEVRSRPPTNGPFLFNRKGISRHV